MACGRPPDASGEGDSFFAVRFARVMEKKCGKEKETG